MRDADRAVTDMFVKALLSLETEEECRNFLDDVLTIRELHDIAQRLHVAKCLAAGVKYAEVSRLTGASSTTISRVNRCYEYGAGGYKTVLGRIAETEK